MFTRSILLLFLLNELVPYIKFETQTPKLVMKEMRGVMYMTENDREEVREGIKAYVKECG